MRRSMIILSCVLLLAGCNTVKGFSTLMSFGNDPLVKKAEQGGATKQEFLAMQQPKRITPIRNASSQCFDYELQSEGKRQDLYVAFTDTGIVNAYAFNTCANALKAGYLDSNKLPRDK